MEDAAPAVVKEQKKEEEWVKEEKNNSTTTADSTDVTLTSMRCHDCGQQFSRWQAFKTHLRMHVLEEQEEEEARRRQTAKRPGDTKTSDTAADPHVPEKRPRTEVVKVKEMVEEKGRDNSDVDVDGVDEGQDNDFSWQVKPSPPEVVVGDNVKVRRPRRKKEEKPAVSSSARVYACSTCGKVYSYLESFRNHQKMHEQVALEGRRRPRSHKCQHPGCDKAFTHAGHLAIHGRAHHAARSAPPPAASLPPGPQHCHQCNKTFTSPHAWTIHMELHRQKPYWCLACAKGFKAEPALDKHLQGHNLRKHTCDICLKSFRVPAELKYHYNTHTGAKPYQCPLCQKCFSQMGNLITHRKKHVGVYLGASKTPLGSRNCARAGRRRVEEMKRLVFPLSECLKELEDEEEEIVAERKATSGPEESGSSSSSSGSDSDRSTSGSSKSSSSDSSEESDSSESGMEKPHGGEEEPGERAGAVASGQSRLRGEWECFECDVAFDHQSELHMHYMWHASGQLAMQ